MLLYLLPLLASGFVLAALAGFAYLRRMDRPGTKAGIALLLCGAQWALADALQLSSPDMSTRVFWNEFRWLGVVGVPTSWLVYVLQYTGRERLLTRRLWALLLGVPILTLGLMSTNDLHHWMWTEVRLVSVGPFLLFDKAYSLGHWAFVAYFVAVTIAGGYLLLRAFAKVRYRLSWLTMSVLFVGLVPAVAWILRDVFDWSLLPYNDLAPMGLAICAPVVVWWAEVIRRKDVVEAASGLAINSTSDGILVLDENGRILQLNAVARQLAGTAGGQAIGLPIRQVWPGWPENGDSQRSGERARELVLGDDDHGRIYDVRLFAQLGWHDEVAGQVAVLRDITASKRAEAQLRASLRQKEVLLKEVHHRVKNNLQVISSLLYLQSCNAGSPATSSMFQESQNRVRSMALVHEKLYQSSDLARIDFADYAGSLAAWLFQSFGTDPNRITLKVQVDQVHLSIDHAIPCGLIINELVSNSLKHAFPNGQGGQVRLECRADGGRVELLVADNGVGLPSQFDVHNPATLGLSLVHKLVQQLDGNLQLDNHGGTAFVITFSVPPQAPQGESEGHA